jgi:hypothetical protein
MTRTLIRDTTVITGAADGAVLRLAFPADLDLPAQGAG